MSQFYISTPIYYVNAQPHLKIKQGGTVVLELSQDEREKMRRCMENVYRAAKDIVGEELLNLVTNSIGK